MGTKQYLLNGDRGAGSIKEGFLEEDGFAGERRQTGREKEEQVWL